MTLFSNSEWLTNTSMNPLDPYEKSEGDETVLHWACQCKTRNAELLQKLLDFKNE